MTGEAEQLGKVAIVRNGCSWCGFDKVGTWLAYFPEIVVFVCMANVLIIFYSLVYMSFEYRLNL